MEDQTIEAGIRPNLVGIRGWLVLAAIVLVVNGIGSVISVGALVATFSPAAMAGSPIQYCGLFALEIVAQLFVLYILVTVSIRFFQKKRDAPDKMIGLMLLFVVVPGVLIAIELGGGFWQQFGRVKEMPTQPFAIAHAKQLARAILGAAIWIPYFRKSERVKATFTN